jgi:hypothetical protein
MEAKPESLGMTLSGSAQFRTTHLTLKDGKVPDLQFEVTGTYTHPADVIRDLLIHPTHGMGMNTATVITDVGQNGLASSSYRTYCTAIGFTTVGRYGRRTEAASLIDELLEQTNATAIWSEGKLKIVPLGDKTVGSYVPVGWVAALNVDHFIFDSGSDPIAVERTPEADVYNTFPVTFKDSTADYADVTQEYIEPAHSANYGVRRASALDASWLMTKEHALALSTIKANRSINIRNTYSFKLSHRWTLLEPMDIVLLSEANFGLVFQPVRIKSITESADGSIQVEAWEWPAGASSVVTIPAQAYDGYSTPTLYPVNTSVLAESKASKDLADVPAGTVGNTLLGAGEVDASKLTTSAAASDNLFPNGNSENDPPVGADPYSAEWYWRH